MKPPRLADVVLQFCRISTVLLSVSIPALAQTGGAALSRQQFTAEQRTARALELARANPLELHAFLVDMPKGADLHIHLSGAVYAEDGLRVNVASLAFVKPQHGSDNSPAKAGCEDGKVPAAQAYKDQHLYDALVDSFSMRGFVPSPGITAHDHFFDTFDKFGGTDHRHKGEWLDEVATRAAAQNEQYLELMETPDFSHAAALAREIGWHDDFGQMRDALLARGLRDEIPVAKTAFDQAEATRANRERCEQRDAAPAC